MEDYSMNLTTEKGTCYRLKSKKREQEKGKCLTKEGVDLF